jgi:hypothetical protein
MEACHIDKMPDSLTLYSQKEQLSYLLLTFSFEAFRREGELRKRLLLPYKNHASGARNKAEHFHYLINVRLKV